MKKLKKHCHHLFFFAVSFFILANPLYSQNVGIGTDNPQAKLHVSGGSVRVDYNAPYLYLNDTSQGNYAGIRFQLQGNTLGNIHFRTNSDFLRINADAGSGLRNDLVIKSNGNIGIGTANPVSKLHIIGDNIGLDDSYPFIILNDTVLDQGNAGLLIENVGVQRAFLYYSMANNLFKISTETGSGYRDDFIIDNDGNIGLGTAAPQKKLQLVGSDTLGSLMISPDEVSYNDKSELILAEDRNDNYNMSIRYDGVDNKLKIFTKMLSNTYGPHMVITRQDGDVGIGLTSPAEKLDVNGNILSHGNLIAIGTLPFININATATNTGGIGFKYNGSSKGWIFFDYLNNYLKLNADAGSGSRADLVINSSGNIGLGTASPTEKLQVSGNIRVSSASPYIYMNNTNSTGYSTIKFQEGGVDNKALYLNNTSESFILYDYSQSSYQFVVTETGRIGIGTSSPAYQLEVADGDVKSGGDFITASIDGVINAGGAINEYANVIGDATNPTLTYATGDEDLYIEDDLELGSQGYKPGGGSWATVSDARLKKDIKPYTDGLTQLMQVKPVTYSYNGSVNKSWDNGKQYVGVIAQDIKKVAPYMVEEKALGRVVSEGKDGSEQIVSPGKPYLTFDGSALTYMLINSVKEQQQIIENQQMKIDELSRKVESLMEIVGKSIN